MEGVRVTVLGGTGRMGSWFARYFKEKGCEVVIWARTVERLIETAEKIGVDYALEAETAVRDSDLVMVSVPISGVIEVVRRVSPHVRRGAILFDVASVKGNIPELLKIEADRYKYNAVSIHPMFGPGAKGLQGQKIVIIPLEGHEEAARWLAGYFAENGAKVLFSNAKTHDRMVALTLALPHFLNIFFAVLLAESGETPRMLRDFSGTTFKLQVTLSESVLQENPNVYAEIQVENMPFKELLEKGEKIFREMLEIVKSGDKNSFIQQFLKARGWAVKDEKSKEAYAKMYRMIELLDEN